MNRTQAALLLPPYMQKKHITAAMGFGTNGQLVNAILKDYPAAVAQTRKLARRFKGPTLDATAHAVWQFLKTQIQYKEDGGLQQHMRLPNALIATGVGDCKSYSLFAAGIMANLGYPVTFRFAGYGGATFPGHVYIIAGSGINTRIIDAVYKAYNEEKKPTTFKKDYPMEIATISGLGCINCQDNSIGKIELKKSLDKAGDALRAKKKQLENYAKTKLKPLAKKLIDLEKKAAFAIPRTAFLQLVKLNVHSFASRLANKRADALILWGKIGGDKGELNASINAGLKRKPILGIDGIGLAGETIAAILVSAAPIIATFAVLLGKTNPNPSPAKGDDTPDPDGTRAAAAAALIINNAANFLNSGKGQNNTTTNNGGEAPQPADKPQPDASTSGSKWLLPAAIVAAFVILK